MLLEIGAWTLFPSIITICSAILTRQVILSLLIGVVSGSVILANFDVSLGLANASQGIIDVFRSDGAAKSIIFGIMIGGVVHLARITGGMHCMVDFLAHKAKVARGPISTQLLAVLISCFIFIESNIALLTSGTVTGPLAKRHRIAREQMAFIIKTAGISVWSSVMMNGWGAVMMGVISVQIGNGFIKGEPLEILARSMVFNLFAWASLLLVLISIFTNFAFPRMRAAKARAAQGVELRDGAVPLLAAEDAPQRRAGESASNFAVPFLAMLSSVPIALYITGGGDFMKGSGATSVFWAVLIGQVAGFIHYVFLKRLFSIEEYTRELLAGYQSMLPIAVVLTLAFFIGNVSGQLNVGAYLSQHLNLFLSPGLTAAFVFTIAALISLSTGTSWGTFSIMIPIGIQLAVAADVDPYLVIGAAISGSILGDALSPISDTALVCAMATGNDLMDHVKTQIPYSVTAGVIALIGYAMIGSFQ
ncbi:Na+/H+ antiporter NhaC family protein [Pseudomonas sp. RAC1]|uniref:Na+/H+ antiporter NhaC family protein n=1 Tax=Pseudomonas sp. RAC1 TaxID=3064900 RepID=UPI00271E1F69|nr:Na+/H+ antiporter NhaC family protein [Pseudomonas sp. RAC1]MDV9033032.1 Na+/H+ antiporter NhaC family protein [Pseudomonas sp. RAC1]